MILLRSPDTSTISKTSSVAMSFEGNEIEMDQYHGYNYDKNRPKRPLRK